MQMEQVFLTILAGFAFHAAVHVDGRVDGRYACVLGCDGCVAGHVAGRYVRHIP